MTFRKLEFTLAGFASVVALVVYLLTLCPTVDFIDAGELATVTTTLGIAHPTGYPLFTLVGWIFAHLPIGVRTISKVNFMAAMECSLALFVFFRFLVYLLSEFSLKGKASLVGKSSGDRASERNFTQILMPAFCGTLALAFSETFWSQALSIEVYSLHTLFLSVLLYVFSRAMDMSMKLDVASSVSRRRLHRSLVLGFAYVLGLAFTNHMTTILLAPAFVYLYFYANGFSKNAWRGLFKLSIPFIIGFSEYLYLPLRAGEKPIMNWGNPITLERFLWHFTGKQYRVWLFSSSGVAMKQLSYFMDTVLPEFAYLSIGIAIFGLWKLFKEARTILVFTLLLFFGCVLYSINYDIHDIDSYFLLAYYAIAIWVAIGAASIVRLVNSQSLSRIAIAALLLICISMFIYNHDRVDGSKNFMVEDYTKNMFASVEPNALIISYQWDYFVSAAYYFQVVERFRPDVIVIDKELMRRSWYYGQLETRYPWLVDRSRKELDEFLQVLYKFEHDLPYDPSMIERRYAALIKSLIEKNIASRPVYVTFEIEENYTSDFRRVPAGLAFRLVTDTLYHDFPMPPLLFRPAEKTDNLTEQIVTFYAQAYTNKAIYTSIYGKRELSLEFLDEALEVLPTYREAIILKSRLNNVR